MSLVSFSLISIKHTFISICPATTLKRRELSVAETHHTVTQAAFHLKN